jgi:hypothetical protein
MKISILLCIFLIPVLTLSQSFPSIQKVKNDLVSNKVLSKNEVSLLEQTEYPWELGIVKLYNRKTQDSVIPDYFNKATRLLNYNLPPTYSMNMCKVSVVYVKMKPNESWKYYMTISEGCPNGSINTVNLVEETQKNQIHLQTSFLESFRKKPSDWAEIENLLGVSSTDISITEAFGGAKLTYTIDFTVYYKNEVNFVKKTYSTKATLFNNNFTPLGNIVQKSENTLNELPASLITVN